MSQAEKISCSYSVWKQVVQGNNFVAHWVPDDDLTKQGTAYAGTDAYVYVTRIVDDTWVDFDTNFPSGTRVEHSRRGDALATIVGLSNVPDVARSADGTPLSTSPNWVLGNVAFKRSDNGTEPMNIDGRSSGDATNVWNGTGAGDTGSDWAASGAGSESATAMHSGTNGWDTGVTAQNDTTIFNSGSMQDIAGIYAELKFWINPQAFPVGSSIRVAFLDGSNAVVGNPLKVEDYTGNQDLGVWQEIAIPISDFGLTGNAQKLAFQYRVTSGQQHYFDDISLVEPGGGGPYLFQVQAPDNGKRYHLTMLVVLISGPSSGWDANSFANISALPLGLLLRQKKVSTGETVWKFNSKDNVDMFGRYHPQDDVEFADGTLMVGFMVKPGSNASIIVTNDDILEFVVRDDLSSISAMRAFAHYGEEVQT